MLAVASCRGSNLFVLPIADWAWQNAWKKAKVTTRKNKKEETEKAEEHKPNHESRAQNINIIKTFLWSSSNHCKITCTIEARQRIKKQQNSDQKAHRLDEENKHFAHRMNDMNASLTVISLGKTGRTERINYQPTKSEPSWYDMIVNAIWITAMYANRASNRILAQY